MLTKRTSRSGIYLTRLETRTKESNMCASLIVLNRLLGEVKAMNRLARVLSDPSIRLDGNAFTFEGATQTVIYPLTLSGR